MTVIVSQRMLALITTAPQISHNNGWDAGLQDRVLGRARRFGRSTALSSSSPIRREREPSAR